MSETVVLISTLGIAAQIVMSPVLIGLMVYTAWRRDTAHDPQDAAEWSRAFWWSLLPLAEIVVGLSIYTLK